MTLAVAGVLSLSVVSAALYFVEASTPHRPLVWQLALIGFAWLCSAWLAWQFVWRLPLGEIEFDGEQWYLADVLGTLSVGFDGQFCLLLRFEDDLKRVTWLWSTASFAPSHWHDLRRAVYSRAALSN